MREREGRDEESLGGRERGRAKGRTGKDVRGKERKINTRRGEWKLNKEKERKEKWKGKKDKQISKEEKDGKEGKNKRKKREKRNEKKKR